MVFLRRIITAVILLLLLISCFLLAGGAAINHFAEPFILILVLGTTFLLGLLTYKFDEILGVFQNLFSRRERKKNPKLRRITAQLALYGLISGILLAIIQILYRLGPSETAFPEANRSETLRIPLVTLFYGVLTSLGFWVASGSDSISHDPDSLRKQSSSERNQVIIAFCVLLMSVGLLSLLIIGMNLDIPERKTHVDPDLMEAVFGLEQGDDMVWRPVKLTEQSLIESPDAKDISTGAVDREMLIPKAPSLLQEPPLRWEPALTNNVQNPPFEMVPSTARQTPQ